MLILLIVGSTGAGVSAALRSAQWMEEYTNLTVPVLWAWIGCAAANVVACSAMWTWRRWGFVLALESFVIAAGIELYIGPPWWHVARLPVALYLLIRFYAPERDRFR